MASGRKAGEGRPPVGQGPPRAMHHTLGKVLQVSCFISILVFRRFERHKEGKTEKPTVHTLFHVE